MRVRTQPAAIERGENAGLAAKACIVDRGVGLMAVDMQRAAAGQMQWRVRVLVVVVAAADDGALAILRHHERQRRLRYLAMMYRDAIARRHVDKHAAEPIVGDRGQEVGLYAELGAAKGGGYRIAAKGDGEVAGDRLLVTSGHYVGDEGDVDIGLADE